MWSAKVFTLKYASRHCIIQFTFCAMETPSSLQISSNISVRKMGTSVQTLILIYFLLQAKDIWPPRAQMHVRSFLCDDVLQACPVCVIVTMIVTLHAGKSMMTNKVVSKTIHHSPAQATLGSFSKDPVLLDIFSSHPTVSTPHRGCHTSPH